ncbi:MAG: hypothetical protein NTZ78_14785 [Candidatus Aureabacteria bacterium]|nr:hypothetical protein [Candidatus Auribacterota bacterium]
MKIIIFAITFFASSLANASPSNDHLAQYDNVPFSPDLIVNPALPHSDIALQKIGRVIEGRNLTWGDSVGWLNLRTTHAKLKIGSNILAGWIWLENCGWVCLGEGRPLDGGRYSNRGAYNWGVNNDGQGRLSGFAWSEITGWISFRTNHSRVYLDETGQFYGYAWGENAGWLHFGPGWKVSYLAKTDPAPWKEIGQEWEDKLAAPPDDSEICSRCDSVTGLKNDHERYNEDADSVCSLRLRRDDSCAHIRRRDTLVYISSLAKLSPIRAPPMIG